MDRDLRLRVLFEALDKVSKPLREISGRSGDASQALRETQSRLQELNKTQASISAFRKLKQGMQDTARAMQEAQARVAALAQQLQATENPTKKLQAEFDRARRAAAALKTEHQEQALKLQRLRDKLAAAGIPTNRLAEHERRLRLEAAKTNDELAEQAKRLDALKARSERLTAGREAFGKVQGAAGSTAIAGAASLGAGLAAAAPLAGASREAMTFESAMADVRKVVDFPTPAAFEAMSNDILDMSTRIPMAAEGLAQIVASAGRAGVAREELLRFAEDAAKMGVAFDTTADDAGEMMAKWRTAFGLGQSEVVALADQINALTNSYGSNVQAVTDMVTRIGPLGKVAGLTAPQIASIAQLMNKVGVEAEVGATGIKNMMLRLTQGAAATKSQQEAFKALGLNAEAVAKAMQADASGTILDVMERVSGLSADRQASILTQLFGSESVAAISPLLTNLDQLKKNLALVGDASQYAGSMEKEFLTRIATTEGAVGLARNAFSALNMTLGKQLLPSIVAFSKRGGEILNRLRAWANENPRLVKGMLWIAGILAGVLTVFGGLALAIAALMAPFAALAFVAGALGVALLPAVGIAAAVASGLAALGVAAYQVYKHWDTIADFFRGVWDRIKTAFDGGLWGVLALLWDLGGMALSAIADGITAAANWLGEHGPGLISAAWDAFTAVLWNGVRLLPRLFLQFGVNTIRGLIDGITSMFPNVGKAVKMVADGMTNFFKDALGIHSPSRVFAELGGHTMAGLSRGLAKGEREPLERISLLGQKMTDALAVGATTASLAVVPPAAATSGPAGAPVAAASGAASAASVAEPAASYAISLNFYGPSNAREVEQAVYRVLDRIERERAARNRSSYRDID